MLITMTSASPVYSFLGPRGTFTEDALRQVAEAAGAEWKPVSSVVQAIDDVVFGRSYGAVIPIENSIEGGVTATQDALAVADGVRILGEYLVPITFNLYVRPGVSLDDVRVVTTHPVSYPQCRGWLSERLPDHEFIPASSNAAAVASLAATELVDAAIAGPSVLDYYDVDTVATNIGDNTGAVTRFLLIGRGRKLPEPTGRDKTSLIIELPADRSGVLMELLEHFSTRGINLSRLESRPVGDELGRYRFNIDAEGHVRDARVAEALMGIQRFSPRVIFLGSYPRANGNEPSVGSAHTNEAFASSRAWLNKILGDD